MDTDVEGGKHFNSGRKNDPLSPFPNLQCQHNRYIPLCRYPYTDKLIFLQRIISDIFYILHVWL